MIESMLNLAIMSNNDISYQILNQQNLLTPIAASFSFFTAFAIINRFGGAIVIEMNVSFCRCRAINTMECFRTLTQ